MFGKTLPQRNVSSSLELETLSLRLAILILNSNLRCILQDLALGVPLLVSGHRMNVVSPVLYLFLLLRRYNTLCPLLILLLQVFL